MTSRMRMLNTMHAMVMAVVALMVPKLVTMHTQLLRMRMPHLLRAMATTVIHLTQNQHLLLTNF